MNFFQATPKSDSTVLVAAKVEQSIVGAEPGKMTSKMTIGIRPEHITYSHDAGDWEGTITVEEQLGSDAFLYVDVPELGQLTVRAVGERSFGRGDKIFLSFDPERCHLFDAHDQRIN
jgi:multiple sugar transport system ATP-binding protein